MQALLIISMFVVTVAGAALAGWWYARESTPIQGPIVLISIDGLRPAQLPSRGSDGTATPSMDALAADAVVFEQAYTHSPLTLPATHRCWRGSSHSSTACATRPPLR